MGPLQMQRPLFFVLTALVPLLLYARTVTFDFVRADDVDLIAGNQAFLSDPTNLPGVFTRSYFEVEGDLLQQKTYYRPVAIASFVLDAARAGAAPSAYHLTNIVLHAAVTCLILLLARRWGAPPLAAIAAALLFATHPVNVQAVAWIAGRNDLLLALFGLLSLLAWCALARTSDVVALQARESNPRSAATSPTRRSGKAMTSVVAAHVTAFALAVFSKETGILFLVLAVLSQGLVIRAPLTRAQKLALALDGVVIVVWALFRSYALAGMPSELSSRTLAVVGGNAPQLLLHLRKVLFPVGLNVAPGIQDRDLLLAALALVTLGIAASRYLTRELTLFAGTWVLLLLLPTLTVAGLPAYEHRAYVPLIGLVLVFAVAQNQRPALAPGVGRPHLGESRAKPGAATWAVVAGITVLAAMTWMRQDVFRNAVTYWTDAARDPVFGSLAHVNLGQLHEADGRLTEARREYLRALERDPATPKAHNNLGVVLMKLDQPSLALPHFEEETRRHPWNADAWFNLGLFEEIRGDEAAARRHYARAIQENPAFLPAYEKLGLEPPAARR
jgi:tetratricopeptide (TPR) repeat protein